MNESLFVYDYDRVYILESRDGADIHFRLMVESRKQPRMEQEKVLCRFRAFPALIGAGENDAEAENGLLRVFDSYVRLFIEKNGPNDFKAKLTELGFKPSEVESEEEAESSSRVRSWMSPRREVRINTAAQIAC